MRRSRLVPILTGIILLAACSDARQPTAPAAPSASRGGLTAGAAVTVMTRNLYLGANIDALLAPGADPAVVLPAALTQLQHTDFPARAQYLAAEIAQHHPHAVGLQEVTHYRFDFTGGGSQELDFLDILQLYLAGMGAQYDVAVRQNNVTLTIPLGGAGGLDAVTYTDGEAILVRHDVTWSAPAAGHYPTQVELSVAGFTFDNLRGWNAVTIDVNGSSYRFVNTHLEIQMFRPVQEAQAAELVQLLQDESLPVVLVGDFNSAANASAPTESKTDSYHILRNAGYQDIELREPHSATMLTCCNADDLSNPTPSFEQRLDLVLARFGPAGFSGQSSVELVGTDDRFLDGSYYLWPSDHAGGVANLGPSPGLLASR
jgi:endonuclease/exonuclease/phosphatase family metal-dependent hydrolase